MVQLNKDERVWVCFEMARVQNDMQYKDCVLTVGPGRRVPTAHEILKNYGKYM